MCSLAQLQQQLSCCGALSLTKYSKLPSTVNGIKLVEAAESMDGWQAAADLGSHEAPRGDDRGQPRPRLPHRRVRGEPNDEARLSRKAPHAEVCSEDQLLHSSTWPSGGAQEPGITSVSADAIPQRYRPRVNPGPSSLLRGALIELQTGHSVIHAAGS